MKVLVTTASRHGATAEIGERLGRGIDSGLRAHGVAVEVDVVPPREVRSVASYDAVVLGSAIYFGRWLKDAEKLVERESDALRERPVWLFSSGPIVPGDDAGNLKWIDTPWAVEHHLFGGRLDSSVLSFGERLAARMTKAPNADGRSFDDVDAWAARICAALVARG